MENCKRCGAVLPIGANFCPACGRAVVLKHSQKKRGNGQGTIKALDNGKYMLTVTLGYYTDEDGKRHRKTRSRVFERKKDAVAAVPVLLADPRKEEKKTLTFKELYDKWLPTHRAGKSTMDCYKAAFKYFAPLYGMRMSEIDVDDLQECVDDCPRGKRTRVNMKAVCGLVYKYGIPRKVIPDNLNLAPFLIAEGESAAHRSSFTDVEIEKIKKACGKIPHAEEIYCMIYTGFRPSEFLALQASDYDAARKTLTGGAKTAAGKNRVVTLSPKIAPLIAQAAAPGGTLFADSAGKPYKLQDFTENVFYPALDAIGIDNPIVEIAGGVKRHKLTPHSCRHTFATLMKRVGGADKDKLELIGHASGEMLRYYQDVDIADLQKITDAI
jgi:integrase/ribosomal protein L40E